MSQLSHHLEVVEAGVCHRGSSIDPSFCGQQHCNAHGHDVSSLLVAGGTKAQSMKPLSGSPESESVWEIWRKITR